MVTYLLIKDDHSDKNARYIRYYPCHPADLWLNKICIKEAEQEVMSYLSLHGLQTGPSPLVSVLIATCPRATLEVPWTVSPTEHGESTVLSVTVQLACATKCINPPSSPESLPSKTGSTQQASCSLHDAILKMAPCFTCIFQLPEFFFLLRFFFQVLWSL